MIEEEVLKRIKPDDVERHKLEKILSNVMDRLKGYEAEVEGSFRKGTWLKGDTDLDVFVFFPKEVGKEYLKEMAIKELVSRFSDYNYTIAYAEHPYLMLDVEGVEVDIVPALKVLSGSEAVTAADRTPFHTRFVTQHLDEKGKDEVRLLKRFLKGIGAYGAEIKVQGFSGYVSELLIIHYETFKNTLAEASKWVPPVKVYFTEPAREFTEPLQIPDPVDPRRNAASAVSMEKLGLFSLASRYYLKEPSMEFFFPKEPHYDKIKGDILLVNVILEENVVEDILWGQVWRNVDKIRNILTERGFRVIDISAWGNNEKLTIAIQLESKDIGKYYLNIGPYFYQWESIDNFVRKNENIWIGRDGRLYSIKERKETDVTEIVKSNLSFKHKFKLELEWVKEVKGDPCLMRFLRKSPPWLK
ncbi:CCA tRNA nucleotidyltransferase [Stygiolobus caldivivus]|uniref:CCA-adding enzyme n=1 Tax=Stygiolobus caldivivus TaxID=2824673 RepID=A0A8D5ZJ54_9CREN|nr:CCA tRNA nucleotidyltransferase [Stygiolobus caldivivus]BCU70246.1 tRNA CCA-pyrophosphorylase [Stygiolobus caldivivus]